MTLSLRSGHFWYDLYTHLSSPKLMLGVLAVMGFLILYIDFTFIYPTIVGFIMMFALRGLIGRRCPTCDSKLKEVDAFRDKESAFILHIVWQCPHDGYEETEATKGDAGLFGAS